MMGKSRFLRVGISWKRRENRNKQRVVAEEEDDDDDDDDEEVVQGEWRESGAMQKCCG